MNSTTNSNTYKNKHNWLKDFNITHNKIKLLEENIGRKFLDISQSNIFTDMSPRAGDIKERIFFKMGSNQNKKLLHS